MKTITIGFASHKEFMIGSVAIEWLLNTDFSHTYFKFKEDRFQDHTIFHAVGKGLIYMAETTFVESALVVKEFDLQISDDLFQELMVDCHINAGKDYAYWQNLGILFDRILAKFNIKMLRNPFKYGINCSEWMYYIIEEIDGKWTDTDPNLVAPDEVYNYLLNRKK